MEKRVAVIDSGLEVSALAHWLAADTIDIVQATQEQQKNVQQRLDLPEPIMIHNRMVDIAPQMYPFGEKPFVCKGKHQYREVKPGPKTSFTAAGFASAVRNLDNKRGLVLNNWLCC